MIAGRTALVTGASSGIGAAATRALIDNGCRVVAAARRLDRLHSLKQELGDDVMPLELDVANASQVDTLLERLPEPFRDISILVNNAAHDVGGRSRFDSSGADEWDAVIQTNFNGLVRLTRTIVPIMLARGQGDIVNLGSTNAMRPIPHMAVYTATKAAVHAFTDILRADYAGSPIRVSEIVPGLTRTEFAEHRFRGDKAQAEAFFDKFPVTLTPHDIARTITFALSQPDHVTIAQLVVMPSTQW